MKKMLMKSLRFDKMLQSPDDPNYVILRTDNGMNFRLHAACATPTKGENEDDDPKQVFRGAVEFPKQLFNKVCGPKRSSINELRKTTGAKITISDGAVNQTLVISTNSQAKLDEAVSIIKAHVDSVVLSQPYTHFICIPCVDSPAFSHAARDYVQRINGMCQLTSDALDNIYRLHITLCSVRLLNDEQITKCAEVLKATVSGYDWTYKNTVEISGINTLGTDSDGPKQFVAQMRGSDETINIKELQTALVADLKKEEIDVVDIPQQMFISLIKRSWVKGTSWGGPGMVEMSFNTQLPPAPIKSVALCKRYVWRTQNFFFTVTSCKLGPTSEDADDGQAYVEGQD
jgi:hypothetical protein